jgi:hypothetical protein
VYKGDCEYGEVSDLKLVMSQRGMALEGMNCADGVWQVPKKAGMRGKGVYECVRGRAWLVGKLRGWDMGSIHVGFGWLGRMSRLECGNKLW